MLDAILEFLKSVASNAVANLVIDHADKVRDLTGLATAIALAVCLAKRAGRKSLKIWKQGRKSWALLVYYAQAATSLSLTRAALLWYASLTSVIIYHQYSAGTQIPDYLHTNLSIGTGCLLAHSLYTWFIWGRTKADTGQQRP